MADMQPEALHAVIGRRVRELREASGRSQDELAEAARRAGLGWSRSAVAALETGRRRLDAEELVLLPAALRILLGHTVALADLIPDVEWVALGRMHRVAGWALRDYLAAAGPHPAAIGTTVPAGEARTALTHQAELRLAFRRFIPKKKQTWELLDLVAADALGDAEQHAALALHVPAAVVSAAAHGTWGHGLTAEREARVAERAPPDASRRSIQAIRGHVSRALIEDLRNVIRTRRTR